MQSRGQGSREWEGRGEGGDKDQLILTCFYASLLDLLVGQ